MALQTLARCGAAVLLSVPHMHRAMRVTAETVEAGVPLRPVAAGHATSTPGRGEITRSLAARLATSHRIDQYGWDMPPRPSGRARSFQPRRRGWTRRLICRLAHGLLLPGLSRQRLGAQRRDTGVSAAVLVTHRLEGSARRRPLRALARGRLWTRITVLVNAANLSMETRATGCFCERWEGNSVEHGRVVYAQRDRTLRIEGALGPLQEMGATGLLQFALAPSEAGTALTVTYRVRAAEGGLEKLAAVVDRVIGEQARRLAAHVAAK